MHRDLLILDILSAYDLQLVVENWHQVALEVLKVLVNSRLQENFLADVDDLALVGVRNFLLLVWGPDDPVDLHAQNLSSFRHDHDLEILAELLHSGVRVVLGIHGGAWTDESLGVIHVHLAGAHVDGF